MLSFGLRWRLARGASNLTRQVLTGVMATVIVSVLAPIGARTPASTPPEPKVTLRIEPEAQPAVVDRPLIQQASEVVEVDPAPLAPTHAAKAISHRPRVVAVLPPVRPRETPDIIAAAPAPGGGSGWDWLANSHAAVDVTVSALDTSKRWALEGKDMMSQAASSATAAINQAVRFGP